MHGVTEKEEIKEGEKDMRVRERRKNRVTKKDGVEQKEERIRKKKRKIKKEGGDERD